MSERCSDQPYSVHEYTEERNPVRRNFAPRLGLDFDQAPKVAIFEDRPTQLDGAAGILAEFGFRPVGYLINPYYYPPNLATSWDRHTGIYERHLARQVYGETRFVAAVCDKGLGDTNGIELTGALKECAPTLMLTGEPDTRETHRVGSAYLEKPYDAEVFISKILVLTGYALLY